jgi:rhodanese-related sulfurtransferase
LSDWELEPLEAKDMIFGPGDSVKKAVLLDFRNPLAFNQSSILNSVSIDVGLGLADPNPFSSAIQLTELHRQLDMCFQPPSGKLFGALGALAGRKVIAICQNGTACRTVTSVMRSKGFEAYCIIGGIDAWHRAGLPLNTCGINDSPSWPLFKDFGRFLSSTVVSVLQTFH